MDLTGETLAINMRTDANNLVTTAKTTHLPEQEETIHMINLLRHEAQSGQIDDLAHVVTEDMLADCLTKSSIKPDNLVKAVTTGKLLNADKQPNFRELMADRHKAYYALASWLCRNISKAISVISFLGYDLHYHIPRVQLINKTHPDTAKRIYGCG